MSAPFRRYDPYQGWVLPPNPREWLPSNHLVYFLMDTVAQLDLTEIHRYYKMEPIRDEEGKVTGWEPKSDRGMPPYNPQMMVTLLLYGYLTGTPSSRRIETKCVEDVGYRVISANDKPDHSTIATFRRIHLKALQGLFRQVLQIGQKAGLVSLGVVALDGTKAKANASKHKAMSYEHMQKSAKELQDEILELLREAERVDEEEDGRHGKGKRSDRLPEELARRMPRLAKIQKAMAELEAEARAEAQRQQALKEGPVPSKGGAPATEPPAAPPPAGGSADVAPSLQAAETSPAVEAGKAETVPPRSEPASGEVPADLASRSVRASETDVPATRESEPRTPTQQPVGATPVAETLRGEQAGPDVPPGPVPSDAPVSSADSCSGSSVPLAWPAPSPKAQRNFTDPESRIMKNSDKAFIQGFNAQAVVGKRQFILACQVTNQASDAPQMKRMMEKVRENTGRMPDRALMDAGYFSEANVLALQEEIDLYVATRRMKHGEKVLAGRGRIPKGATVKERMWRKLRTAAGRAIYALRKILVEPVFGQIRTRGFVRFWLRGLQNVDAEWSLWCTTHNLLKLYRAQRHPA